MVKHSARHLAYLTVSMSYILYVNGSRSAIETMRRELSLYDYLVARAQPLLQGTF